MNNPLVIFDCDGTLVDTEILCHEIGAAEMTKLGFPLTTDRSIKVFSGIADNDLVAAVEKEYGRTITDDTAKIIIQKMKDAIKINLKPIAGISNILEHLTKRNVNKCIASNAQHDHITNALTVTTMDKYFITDKLFNISMVKQGKPSPDLFLHAAKQLGANATDCIVIEDSVVGIKAAKAANMFVIGFLGGAHAQSSWYRQQITELQPNEIAANASELLNVLNTTMKT